MSRQFNFKPRGLVRQGWSSCAMPRQFDFKPSGLVRQGPAITCKKFVVQTFPWSLKFVVLSKRAWQPSPYLTTSDQGKSLININKMNACPNKILASLLTLLCIMMKNSQTYFKNLAAPTPQDFSRMLSHFQHYVRTGYLMMIR